MTERITIIHARRAFSNLAEALGVSTEDYTFDGASWHPNPGAWRLEEWRPGDGHTRVRIAQIHPQGGESNPYPYYMSPSEFYFAALFTLRILEAASHCHSCEEAKR